MQLGVGRLESLTGYFGAFLGSVSGVDCVLRGEESSAARNGLTRSILTGWVCHPRGPGIELSCLPAIAAN
jgi:hypothetical protein